VRDSEKLLDADGVARTKSDWIKDCAKKKKTDMNKKLDGGLCAAEKALAEHDCGKPAQVWDWSPNGSVFMRSFSGAERGIDTRATDQGLELADGDAIGNVSAAESEGVHAHAEMYFECEGTWDDCGEDAM